MKVGETSCLNQILEYPSRIPNAPKVVAFVTMARYVVLLLFYPIILFPVDFINANSVLLIIVLRKK